MNNRVILIAIIVLIGAIWIAAMANACAPRASGSSLGPSWAPIFLGGSWDRGGWDRGTVSNPSPSSSSSSRSSGGSIRSGGIKGGSGGK